MTRAEFCAFARAHDNFVILTHRRPDGDTIGSAGALCLGLRQLGKTAFVLTNEQFTPRFDPFLDGLVCEALPAGATVISADIASEGLLSFDAVRMGLTPVCAVDHHGSNSLACPKLVEADKAACGEIIHAILLELGVTVTKRIAECLYVAISTDTGCFKFTNTTARTHIVAAKLMEAGAEVTVVLLCGKPATSDAADMYARAVGIGAAQCNLETEPYVAMTEVREAEMLVDAVYGIGFHGRLPDALRPVFRLANQSDAPVIALDVPSGFSADSGVYDEDTIRAEYTVTFTAMKPGLLVHGASELTGPVEVAQIGIDPALLDQYAPSQTIVVWEMVRACFLPRPLDSHKGTYGRVLAVCGSVGMAGAAMLAVRAPQRCGAGLVAAALPRSLYPAVAGQNLEAVYRLLPETSDGLVAAEARHLLREELGRASAVLCGCGLGRGDSVTAVVEDLLAQASCPVVLDADGINAAAGHIHIQPACRWC